MRYFSLQFINDFCCEGTASVLNDNQELLAICSRVGRIFLMWMSDHKRRMWHEVCFSAVDLFLCLCSWHCFSPYVVASFWFVSCWNCDWALKSEYLCHCRHSYLLWMLSMLLEMRSWLYAVRLCARFPNDFPSFKTGSNAVI